MVALPERDPQRLRRTAVLKLASDDRVLEMQEKPEDPASQWSCPALYFLQPAAMKRLPEYLSSETVKDAPGHFLAYLVKREPVYAVRIEGARLDIGTLHSYREADAVLRREPVLLPGES